MPNDVSNAFRWRKQILKRRTLQTARTKTGTIIPMKSKKPNFWLKMGTSHYQACRTIWQMPNQIRSLRLSSRISWNLLHQWYQIKHFTAIIQTMVEMEAWYFISLFWILFGSAQPFCSMDYFSMLEFFLEHPLQILITLLLLILLLTFRLGFYSISESSFGSINPYWNISGNKIDRFIYINSVFFKFGV